MKKLSPAHIRLLQALVTGYILKVHRSLDGDKVHKLHPLSGPAQNVSRNTVDSLRNWGLIDSNKKFPVATYFLTEPGKELAATLTNPTFSPLSAKNDRSELSSN